MTRKTRRIRLNRGFSTMVDADLYPQLSRCKWLAQVNRGGQVYAVRGVRGPAGKRTLKMHRVIAGPPGRACVHHLNGNGLDNRRSNLIVLARWQHGFTKRHPRGATGFRGVTRDGRRYRALAHRRGRTHHIGSFGDPFEAALAHDEWSLRNVGPFAELNFPRRVTRTTAVRVLRRAVARVVRVLFVKRSTGRVRSMLVRVSPKYDKPRARRALLVKELPYGRWRVIPFEGLRALKYNGVYYAVGPGRVTAGGGCGSL